MAPIPLAPTAHAAIQRLADAVLALSDDPRPANVERYLAASRALEDSKPRPRQAEPRRRARRRETAR